MLHVGQLGLCEGAHAMCGYMDDAGVPTHAPSSVPPPLCSYVNWPEEQWAGGACEWHR